MPRTITTLLTFITLLIGTLPATTHAAEPPTAPMLRIETGMHTAPISRIDVDRSGRWLVSASDDKTVRVWDLAAAGATGRSPLRGMQPVRIIRPPIGEGNEGKLFSVAISPDGNLVAAGGFTSPPGGYKSIYLFSRHDGRLLGRASGLDNVILHLAFSPDGRYLAVSLQGKSGLRLFAVDAVGAYGNTPLQLIAQDTVYDNKSDGAHFSPDGSRLVTSCYDGYVRVYDVAALTPTISQGEREFKPVVKQKAPGGGQSYSVKFSPDGAKIAVGFYDTSKVNVLSARDLALLYAPDSGGVTNGNLVNVAWSADGRALYAGGMAVINGASGYIRRWSDAGRGGYSDLKSGSTSTIMDLAPMPGGGVAFGSGDPAIGVLPGTGAGTAGRSPLLIPPGVADLRQGQYVFPVSSDGTSVRFGYVWGDNSPATFSLTDRTLTSIQNSSSNIQNLSPPDTTSLAINNWKNTTNPAINNQPLKLAQYETSRSLAISPDRGSFLLGTEWYLRRFDTNGREQWNVPAPGTAWGVNIAPNGSIAAAAFGDGTIRWYRYSDGKELLAFFPHADKKRWVVWTPTGYYDASPGGEELIGWHVNNGKDQAADFFPASKFRSSYYRPDVIAKILDTLDEGEALRLANAESGRKQSSATVAQLMPPVISISSPDNGTSVSTTTVTIRYTVRTPNDAPVTNVRLLVDGRPMAAERSLKAVPKDNAEQSVTVTIPERNCEIGIIAENRHSASVPATVRLTWAGKKQDEFTVQPKLYVLSVGVSAYKDTALTLKYAAKDARDFASAVQKQKGGMYRDVVVKTLSDAQATKDDILDGLDWLKKEVTARDVGIIFIAGHGVNDSTGNYYYLPQNADPDKLMRTGVTFSDIKNTLASLAGKALLFVDTCHSGNVMGSRRGGSADINAVVNELASSENGAVVFASSTGKQYSLEDDNWGNGAFTKALVEGISGKADYGGKGRITVNMLDLWLSERVKELTGGKQTPTTTKPQTIQDFPLALKR